MAFSLPSVPLLESTCMCPALGALQPASFPQAKQRSEPYTEKARLKRLCGAGRAITFTPIHASGWLCPGREFSSERLKRHNTAAERPSLAF